MLKRKENIEVRKRVERPIPQKPKGIYLGSGSVPIIRFDW